MGRKSSNGKCIYCKKVFSKGTMTRHLQSCKERQASNEDAAKQKKAKERDIFHIFVEGRYLPMYWMHLEIPVDGTLEELDQFLRDTWLECCGHLSAFQIRGKSYASSPDEEFDEESMAVSLKKVLSPEMNFYHEYDFGSTTELSLKVLSVRKGFYYGNPVKILARNEAPSFACIECGKPAVEICAECSYDNGGWLCKTCAAGHECGEEMLLPVVNSPRTGVCGYTG